MTPFSRLITAYQRLTDLNEPNHSQVDPAAPGVARAPAVSVVALQEMLVSLDDAVRAVAGEPSLADASSSTLSPAQDHLVAQNKSLLDLQNDGRATDLTLDSARDLLTQSYQLQRDSKATDTSPFTNFRQTVLALAERNGIPARDIFDGALQASSVAAGDLGALMPDSLLVLPEEVLLDIASHISHPQDRAALATTSKKLQKVVAEVREQENPVFITTSTPSAIADMRTQMMQRPQALLDCGLMSNEEFSTLMREMTPQEKQRICCLPSSLTYQTLIELFPGMPQLVSLDLSKTRFAEVSTQGNEPQKLPLEAREVNTVLELVPKNIQSLNLEGQRVNRGTAGALRGLSNLCILTLNDAKDERGELLPAQQLNSLLQAVSPRLGSLGLRLLQINGDTLNILRRFTALEKVNLSGVSWPSITSYLLLLDTFLAGNSLNQTLEALPLEQMREIRLNSLGINKDTMRLFKRLTSVERLELTSTTSAKGERLTKSELEEIRANIPSPHCQSLT